MEEVSVAWAGAWVEDLGHRGCQTTLQILMDSDHPGTCQVCYC